MFNQTITELVNALVGLYSQHHKVLIVLTEEQEKALYTLNTKYAEEMERFTSCGHVAHL